MTAPIMTDLAGLVARCRQATGPDRKLDGDLAVEFSQTPEGAFRLTHFNDAGAFGTGAYTGWFAPAYTGSIDAALALVERVLPGWQVNISTFGGHSEASLGARGAFPNHAAPTPSLAILIALLLAIIAKETP